MDLDNLVEIVVHYHLIEEMTCLGRWDGFPMISALMCMPIGLDLQRIMIQGCQLS